MIARTQSNIRGEALSCSCESHEGRGVKPTQQSVLQYQVLSFVKQESGPRCHLKLSRAEGS